MPKNLNGLVPPVPKVLGALAVVAIIKVQENCSDVMDVSPSAQVMPNSRKSYPVILPAGCIRGLSGGIMAIVILIISLDVQASTVLYTRVWLSNERPLASFKTLSRIFERLVLHNGRCEFNQKER